MEPARGIDLMTLALYKAAVEGKPEDYYTALRLHTGAAVEEDGLQVVMPNGNTVLHVAALQGHENFVENILQGKEIGAALSLLFAQNKENETVLHCAAETGNANIVSILIMKSKDVESGTGATRKMIQMTNNVMDTALHKAVRMGHLEVVKLLVEGDVEFVYPANIAGETPIYIAAKSGFYDCLQQLLDTCKYPTYGGGLGQNALHATVLFSPGTVFKFTHGHDAGITGYTKLLLEKEISLCEMIDDLGWTALHYALKIHDNKTARMILAGKSSAAYICTGKGDEWTTVFHIAARYDNVEMVKYISNNCLDCWMMLNSKCQNVLHEAVLRHRLNVIKYVLKHPKVDNLIEGKDKDGNTPLDLLSYFSWNPLIGVAMEFLILKHLAFTPLENIKWAFSKHLLGWKVIGKGGKIGSRGDLPEKPKEKKDDANIEKDIGFMVETSRTNITVTSLILTMTFTIGLTVPGGYNSNVGRRQGTPLLLHTFQFQAFVMYDLMAFLLSILSIFFHIVMVAEASSTKNYEVIKKYFEWNTRTTLTAALTAVAAFCSGMSATLVPLPVLDIVASVSNFWIYLGIFWLSNTILNIHGSLGLPVTNLILPPIFSILKKLYFFVLRRRPFSYGCLFN